MDSLLMFNVEFCALLLRQHSFRLPIYLQREHERFSLHSPSPRPESLEAHLVVSEPSRSRPTQIHFQLFTDAIEVAEVKPAFSDLVS